jgi:hypothetical protein
MHVIVVEGRGHCLHEHAFVARHLVRLAVKLIAILQGEVSIQAHGSENTVPQAVHALVDWARMAAVSGGSAHGVQDAHIDPAPSAEVGLYDPVIAARGEEWPTLSDDGHIVPTGQGRLTA